MQRARPFTPMALRMSAGVIVWAVHFGVIYGYTGLACARRFDASGATWVALVPWVVGGATLIAAAALLAFIVPVAHAHDKRGFVRWMSACVAALALVAVMLEGAGVLWVPACG